VEVLSLVAAVIVIAGALLRPRKRLRRIWIDPVSVQEKLARRARMAAQTSSEIIIVRETTIEGRCWVIDGDTIDINGVRLRLAGIDAPELDHPYGQRAKRALMRHCNGQVMRAVVDGKQSYDRLVATCYLPDGRDLSAEMVKMGHAIDWPKFSGGKYGYLEPDGIRRKLWRCDARQKGRMPQTLPD
jgi:endonuclease YncB( thermonuclease family)